MVQLSDGVISFLAGANYGFVSVLVGQPLGMLYNLPAPLSYSSVVVVQSYIFRYCQDEISSVLEEAVDAYDR